MALVIADRIREVTSTYGTGAIYLGGAVVGFKTFSSVLSNNDTTYYAVIATAGGAWEVGIGTYVSATNSIGRTTILASSNSNSIVDFASGTKNVIITQPSERAVYVNGTSVAASNGATVPNSLLANSSVTFNGQTVALGSSGTITANTTNALTISTGLSGTSYNGSAAVTIAIDSTVATLTGSQTLTNKTLTAPVIGSIVNTGTLTLPTSTDTLVGRATTDTLTNKTLTTPVISTISNTGTLTLPTSTDTLVGRATTDTLTNKTLTAPLLTAGTATAGTGPLKFSSGTVLTAAEQGVVEYDGTVFYADIKASTRTTMISEQVVVLNTAYTLTSQTAAQKLFNTATAGAVTLPIGTYCFECFFSLSAMSATSGSFGFALVGGTSPATFTQNWWAEAQKGAAAVATATATQSSFNTTANVTLATASVNTVGYAIIKGTLNVTVAGTVIPQVSLGVAAAAVVGVGSYFKVHALSPTSSTTTFNVGNWS